jgi:hypothetical protein
MMRDVAIEPEPAEPPVGQIEMHLLAKTPFGADGEAVAYDQHPDHQFRIDRRSAHYAVERRRLPPHLAQLDKPVDQPQKMIARIRRSQICLLSRCRRASASDRSDRHEPAGQLGAVVIAGLEYRGGQSCADMQRRLRDIRKSMTVAGRNDHRLASRHALPFVAEPYVRLALDNAQDFLDSVQMHRCPQSGCAVLIEDAKLGCARQCGNEHDRRHALTPILGLLQRMIDKLHGHISSPRITANIIQAGYPFYTHIATLVERNTRFTMLVKIPRKNTTTVVAALARHIRKLPEALRRSLTWDQGKEMHAHKRFTVATNVQVYFCDPRSPWQRGSKENTNGLLRQYFPRGTDFSRISQSYLNAIALRLNQRPRKTLGFETPADRLQAVLH